MFTKVVVAQKRQKNIRDTLMSSKFRGLPDGRSVKDSFAEYRAEAARPP